MPEITSTVTITSTNSPYTLSVGSTISVTNTGDSNNSGEAIYTDFSPTQGHTVGGATIVIESGGVVLDGSGGGRGNIYAIQSRAANGATLFNYGIVSATSIVAVGWNDGLIVNKGELAGGGGIRIGYGTVGSTILNYGEITGTDFSGIDFLSPSVTGEVVNEAGGFIKGGSSGAFANQSGIYMFGGTIINAGTIEGGAGGSALDFWGNTNKNELILDPGQVLEGRASATGTTNTLELGGSGLGTLSDPGNYFGFASFVIASGADWQIGTGVAAVSITGVSTISDFGTLVIDGPITGTTINLEGSLGSASVVDFTGAPPSNVVSDFGKNSTIILGGSVLPTPGSPNDVHLSLNTATDLLTVTDTIAGNTLTTTVQLSGVVPGSLVENVGAAGIIITDLACFAAGTRILTPDGQVPVERLEAGDEVLTVRDGSVQKIIWVGNRTIDLNRHAMPEKVIPVVIQAGAFGPGLPERDLRLSPDHALFINGHLIEAKTLVNGTTVIRDRAARFVTYYHIELERHDVVLAEGLPAESYLESGNRQNFESEAGPVALHPDFAALCREKACAPLLLDGAILRDARQQLLDRAVALGFSRTAAIDLVVKTGAERISPKAGRSPNRLLFPLPAEVRNVALISGAGVPAEVSTDPSDRRVLGAAITGLALVVGGKRIKIALNDKAHEGFHEPEAGHRWTNGDARIALPAYAGKAVLEVTLNGQATRWVAPASGRSSEIA
jgi:hypothetical protein